MKFRPITFSEEYHQKYWAGLPNTFVRYYAYLDRGFGVFNQAKNYILMIFGTYWTVKTMEWWIGTGYSEVMLVVGLGTLSFLGICFLVILGRWHMFKANKAIEFINSQTTITGWDGYNMQVFNVSLMEAIAIKLGADVEKIKHE